MMQSTMNILFVLVFLIFTSFEVVSSDCHTTCESGVCKNNVCCGEKGLPDECSACNRNKVCSKCVIGWKLVDGLCLLNDKQPCRLHGDCATKNCQDGFCCNSAWNCEKCSADGCASCPPDLTVINGKCADYLRTGSTCSAATECASDACISKVCCLANQTLCTRCKTNYPYRNKCQTCKTGYSSIKGVCCNQNNSGNCDTCSLDGTCARCDSGYTLHEGKCQCKSGYTLNEGKCQRSYIYDCINKNCTGNATCVDQACYAGTVSRMPFCKTWSDDATRKCTRCIDGYGLKGGVDCYCNTNDEPVTCKVDVLHFKVDLLRFKAILTPWPEFDNNMTVELLIENQRYVKPKDNLLANLTSLKKITIRKTTIPGNTLPPTFFETNTELLDLSLDSNGFTSLPATLFSTLSRLSVLRLYGNKFTTLPDLIFGNLKNLTYLDLSHGWIKLIPYNLFDELFHLRTLSLAYNEIEDIEASTFAGLTLSRLSLQSNQIGQIPVDFLNDTNTTNLFFEDNVLKCALETDNFDFERLAIHSCECNENDPYHTENHTLHKANTSLYIVCDVSSTTTSSSTSSKSFTSTSISSTSLSTTTATSSTFSLTTFTETITSTTSTDTDTSVSTTTSSSYTTVTSTSLSTSLLSSITEAESFTDFETKTFAASTLATATNEAASDEEAGNSSVYTILYILIGLICLVLCVAVALYIRMKRRFEAATNQSKDVDLAASKKLYVNEAFYAQMSESNTDGGEVLYEDADGAVYGNIDPSTGKVPEQQYAALKNKGKQAGKVQEPPTYSVPRKTGTASDGSLRVVRGSADPRRQQRPNTLYLADDMYENVNHGQRSSQKNQRPSGRKPEPAGHYDLPGPREVSYDLPGPAMC
eukprot:m.58110 g.58110  ORF g.58110 m.58110 type:complete len:871 (+) comp11157_c0_seq1:169-2781(+)